MTATQADAELSHRLERIEDLIDEIERADDTATRARMLEIIRTVLDFHGRGLERMVGQLESSGDSGRRILSLMARDELVSSLLALHGLHPLDVEQRVRQALGETAPCLAAHGVRADLLEIRNNHCIIRLKYAAGSVEAAPDAELRASVREAIVAAAPEITAVEISPGEGDRAAT
jgi:hypothetical protein